MNSRNNTDMELSIMKSVFLSQDKMRRGVKMTLYEMLDKINESLTPNSRKFIDYVLWTSDDNYGFLRTCFRKKSTPLEDYNLGNLKFALVLFMSEFDPQMLKTEKHPIYGDRTLTKMQIVFIYDKNELTIEKEYCDAVGYSHFKIFEM